MASAKELKDRIKAVKETRKITGAMYLISSTKLRRAKQELARTKPYFDALREETEHIMRVDRDFRSRYLLAPDGSLPADGVCGVLSVTSDKGLAGAYNLNVIHETEALCRGKPNARILAVGEAGHRYFTAHRYDTVFLGAAETPSLHAARAISAELLDRYDAGEFNELMIVYTDMKNSIVSTVRTQRLLPFPRAGEANAARLEFVPSAEEAVQGILRSYLSGFIYSALLDSFCAEQNARVTAMDAANANAQELLSDLSLQLNRTRQAAITQEITEISAGAQAQKNKHKKGGARA